MISVILFINIPTDSFTIQIQNRRLVNSCHTYFEGWSGALNMKPCMQFHKYDNMSNQCYFC